MAKRGQPPSDKGQITKQLGIFEFYGEPRDEDVSPAERPTAHWKIRAIPTSEGSFITSFIVLNASQGVDKNSLHHIVDSRHLSGGLRSNHFTSPWLDYLSEDLPPTSSLFARVNALPAAGLTSWARMLIDDETDDLNDRQLQDNVPQVIAEAIFETTHELRQLRERLDHIEPSNVKLTDLSEGEAAEDVSGEAAAFHLFGEAAYMLHKANQEIFSRSEKIEARLRSMEESTDE